MAKKICPDCGGFGYREDEGTKIKCGLCKGTGWLYFEDEKV